MVSITPAVRSNIQYNVDYYIRLHSPFQGPMDETLVFLPGPGVTRRWRWGSGWRRRSPPSRCWRSWGPGLHGQRGRPWQGHNCSSGGVENWGETASVVVNRCFLSESVSLDGHEKSTSLLPPPRTLSIPAALLYLCSTRRLQPPPPPPQHSTALESDGLYILKNSLVLGLHCLEGTTNFTTTILH